MVLFFSWCTFFHDLDITARIVGLCAGLDCDQTTIPKDLAGLEGLRIGYRAGRRIYDMFLEVLFYFIYFLWAKNLGSSESILKQN